MKRGLILLLILLGLAVTPAAAQELPRVVLIGDSIRLGYAPIVARKLEGRARVISVEQNGGDSSRVRANLEEWALAIRPDIVHFNAGLHDLKLLKATNQHQVPLDQYRENLRDIAGRLQRATAARIIFAATTPIIDARHAARQANFDRLEADVRRYNGAAAGVMREAGIPINDLHWVVERAGAERVLLKDGTHYTAEGYELLASAVADSIIRQLTIRSYRPLPPQPSGAEAAAAYQKAEKERDALVPARYRIDVPDFPLPESRAAWRRQRKGVEQIVAASLGKLPPRPVKQQVRTITREDHHEFILEKVAIDNGVDGEISALLLIPANLKGPAPAVLWLHSSTPEKTQIIIPGTNGGSDSLGLALVRRGYVVFSPDAYWHGDRVGAGPSGPAETGLNEQQSLFKYHLWQGRTLWGMFVRDDRIALDYLAARPEVDAGRIGATGMSMGSTRAWWLAALDERVAATVGVACLTRYENLINHGELRQHGVYYFVNDLLRHFDTEGVIALIAPRPYLALTGEIDAGSPVDGIRVIEREMTKHYQTLGAPDRFRNIVYPGVAHSFTPEMRAATLDWFDRWLKTR